VNDARKDLSISGRALKGRSRKLENRGKDSVNEAKNRKRRKESDSEESPQLARYLAAKLAGTKQEKIAQVASGVLQPNEIFSAEKSGIVNAYSKKQKKLTPPGPKTGADRKDDSAPTK